MKQRITYFLPEDVSADPEDIQVGSDNLNYTRASEAAQEWRFTLGVDDLPRKVRGSLLQN